MEDEREQTRNETEGSGQQPPLGKQDENQIAGQAGQQPQGQQSQQPSGQQRGQQPLGQEGNFGTQEPGLGNQTDQEFGSTGGQAATGQAQGSDAATLNPDENDVGPGGYSPESGASDLGGGETGLGDSGGGSSGGFVGSQGQDSGEYLQQDGNPETGFAEQGRGASNQSDVERETTRSQNDDSDIEGSSGNS
jgi:hypothetical protein